MLEQYKILKYKHSNESCVNTDSGKFLTIISYLLLLPVDNKIIRVSLHWRLSRKMKMLPLNSGTLVKN